MKKKLLTVLLAVVMVFGVFGLTACSGSNADKDYNYYGVKYEIEGEVAIDAVTFQGVFKMFSDAGKFLLYVDTETSSSTKQNMQKINQLALDWGVTIYHFNPDLSGGYDAEDELAICANIIKDFTNPDSADYDAISSHSNLENIQALFLKASNSTLADWADCTLVAVQGADSTVVDNAVQYNGAIAAANPVADAAKSIAAIATKRPSFGSYTDTKEDVPLIPAAYLTNDIDTINCFADARLHMYDEKGDLTADKEDVYVTVANYAMFAYLMDKNEGYFPVFFGGTWCPNTQAIAKLTNDLAKDYGISKIYFFDPNLADFPMPDTIGTDAEGNKVIVENNDWTFYSGLNTRSNYSDGPVIPFAPYSAFAYLYAEFLDNYIEGYVSEWNVGSKLVIGENSYTKMCVPNIMLFDGEEANKAAKLVGLAEAEYNWGDIAIDKDTWNEESAQYIGWSEAVKAIFDENPYAVYNPIIKAAPEAEEAPSTESSSSSSAAAGGGGGPC